MRDTLIPNRLLLRCGDGASECVRKFESSIGQDARSAEGMGPTRWGKPASCLGKKLGADSNHGALARAGCD